MTQPDGLRLTPSVDGRAHRPPRIGVFDSGMGGLTVLRALLRRQPGADYLYLGDTARLPYGTKSEATVRRYAQMLAGRLVEAGVELVVVACNTVSAVALDAVEALGVPVVGVVAAGARAAAASGGPIGVLGTEATIKSGAYERAIAAIDPRLVVRSRACPLFVPLVEEGWTTGEVPLRVAERYLADLGPVASLLLGCTHYPLLTEVLRATCPGAVIIDSALAVAEDVRATVGGAADTGEPSLRVMVTDGSTRFVELGGRILGRTLANVELVDV